jgi:hypothetical protein
MKSKMIPFLPDEYRIQVGYDYYHDFEFESRAGGPERFEILSSIFND